MMNKTDNNKQTEESLIRLNKFIASAGYCSRRQADRLIEAGKVLLNGNKAELGAKVSSRDEVIVEGKLLDAQKEDDLVYLAFNKPQGVVCTANPEIKDNIIDYINYPVRIFTIGRLDKNSEGLILLSNDGSIFNKIVRAEHDNEKEYLVELNKAYDQKFIERMEKGVEILDKVTNPTKISPVSKTTFKLVLTQGLNRQIRRMCDALGYKVIFLRRLRIMNINLGNLAIGSYRHLSQKELGDLFDLLPEE
ncbi:MAG TPA: pseudouridine synthase [Candidatus Eisenbacteria bacterium]|nr:pseudouridine synthase [Candidatus Eisenbacteria bacterium]